MPTSPPLNGPKGQLNEQIKAKNRINKVKRTAVDYEAFAAAWVKVYKEKGTRFDVAMILGISYEAAMGRYELLKKKGITLPNLSRSSSMTLMERSAIQKIIAGADESTVEPIGLKKPPIV